MLSEQARQELYNGQEALVRRFHSTMADNEKLKEENKALCKTMVQKNRSKKEMMDAQQAMGQAQAELQGLKSLIDKELVAQKESDGEMKKI